MTAGARALRRRRMTDLLAVTARALLGRSRVVLIVAARALVALRCDHRRVLVAARARLRIEVVRLVAARARVVTYGQRTSVDVQPALLLRVATFATGCRRRAGALRQRRQLRLVHAVTVEATVQPCVLRLAAAVTARAVFGRRGRLAMRVVTRLAVFAAVGANCLGVTAIIVVAAHAVPGRDARVRAIAVALDAGGRAI